MYFKIKIFLFIYTILNAVNINASENDEHIICYFNSQAAYVRGYGKFDIERIDPTLCTHVVYMSAGIDRNGFVTSLDPDLDLPEGRDFYGQVNALKKDHPHLKTLLSIDVDTIIARNRTQWLIGSSIRFLGDYGFDGLNLNWGESTSDSFFEYLTRLKVNYDAYGLLLYTSVNSKNLVGYDVATFCRNFHIVGLKTFDLHGPWKNITGHHSPLHAANGEDAVDSTLEYFLKQGCPANKVVIGLSSFGRTYTLVDEDLYKVGAPSAGLGHSGMETEIPGFVSYYEHDYDLFVGRTWRVHFDEFAEVPYYVDTRRWVSIDSPESLAKKAQYALRKQIAGVLFWTLDTDDFRSGVLTYPLLRAVNEAISAGYTEVTTEEEHTTEEVTENPTTEIPTVTTEIPVPGELCTSEGFAPHPADCSKFILCMRNPLGQLVAYELQCPSVQALVQSVWDQGSSVCSLPQIDYCSAPTSLQKFANLIPVKNN
ncbi:chitinase-3-like protein 1 [Pectinophora gossypiella]|uniref:chitinase-3-like protein 1 n=1 Tax=Pectinophora gossypiella TaxID=13191 RepID=UPI00214F1E53|nr:chitinase-3-like protein 1 [Pectinophora gossypiella]